MQLHRLVLDAQIEHRVHQLLCVPEVYEYLADGSEPPQSVAETWVASAQRDWQEHGGGLWALKSTDRQERLFGLVRLSNYAAHQLELTYLLHPSKWHNGLATRMAHTAMDVCFRRGQGGTIWAGADEPNVGSIAVMRRLGMKFFRNVDYPAGRGVEYEMSVRDFSQSRFERLEIICA